MGLNYENLDEATRRAMVSEIEHDHEMDLIYISNYLNEQGKEEWAKLLLAAAADGDDDRIAQKLRERGLLREKAERRTKNGITMVKVPHTAPETMAESEFNRYYARGLCVRAGSEGIPKLEVYRAKAVAQPREGSEEKIGKLFDPALILEDLRKTTGVEPALGVPPGPNSGLTLRIPR